MRHPIVASVAAALLSLAARPAAACSDVDDYERHDVDAAFADDTVAPGLPSVEPPVVRRGDGGDGCIGDKCGSGRWAEIDLMLFAIDDRAPSDRIGFELTVRSGQVPHYLALPIRPVEGFSDRVILSFDPDAGAFEFELEIRAVDLNGNRSAPVVVTVRDGGDDSGACAAGNSRAPGAAPIALALLLALRPRRRR